MRKWAKEHGLLLANIGLFLVFFGGMVVSGTADYSEDQIVPRRVRRRNPRVPRDRRLPGGDL